MAPEDSREPSELSEEELERAHGETLPLREVMSLINANVAIPIDAALAANVLSDESIAAADAEQHAEIDEST